MKRVELSPLLRRAVAAVTGLIVAAGVTLMVATPVQAAYPACTTTARFKTKPQDGVIGIVDVPAVASNSTADCELWEGLSNSGVMAFQKAFNRCYSWAAMLEVQGYKPLDDYMESIGYPGFPYGRDGVGFFLDEDGQFGPMTKAAVKGVQFFHNLSRDGRFGPQSRRSMRWDFAVNGWTLCEQLQYPYVRG